MTPPNSKVIFNRPITLTAVQLATSGRTKLLLSGIPIGEIFRMSDGKRFSLELSGIYWRGGIPNNTGGQMSKVFPNRKTALAAVSDILTQVEFL